MSAIKTSYGLDFSGFSTGKTALVRAEKAGHTELIEMKIIDKHCFNKKQKSTNKIEDIGKKESEVIEEFLKVGPVFVDAPIDLQGLPDPDNPHFIWQLTKRPVDMAFNALPALADRIGACTSRFRYIMRNIMRTRNSECLGKQLFETYPAASLELMKLGNKNYKGGKGAVYKGSQWQSMSPDKKDKNLANLLNELGWSASSNMEINDDEFDASLCAVIGVSPESACLQGAELKCKINEKLRTSSNPSPSYDGPQGYIILKNRPEKVNIDRE